MDELSRGGRERPTPVAHYGRIQSNTQKLNFIHWHTIRKPLRCDLHEQIFWHPLSPSRWRYDNLSGVLKVLSGVCVSSYWPVGGMWEAQAFANGGSRYSNSMKESDIIAPVKSRQFCILFTFLYLFIHLSDEYHLYWPFTWAPLCAAGSRKKNKMPDRNNYEQKK